MPVPAVRGSDDVTLGEVVRRLEASDTANARRFDDLQETLQTYHRDTEARYVSKDVYEAQRHTSDSRLTKLEATNVWIVRTGVGALFTTVAGVIAAIVSTHP